MCVSKLCLPKKDVLKAFRHHNTHTHTHTLKLTLYLYSLFQPAERPDPIPDPRHSPASWRRHLPPGGDSHRLGSSYDRGHKTAGVSPRGEAWSNRGQGSVDQGESRSAPGSRPWNRERQADRH